MNIDNRLKANDITPTTDAVKAYRLGFEAGSSRLDLARGHIRTLQAALAEIQLQAKRHMR